MDVLSNKFEPSEQVTCSAQQYCFWKPCLALSGAYQYSSDQEQVIASEWP